MRPKKYGKGKVNQLGMNKTEEKYALVLENLKHQGYLVWYSFEPVNLRLAPKTYYRPDFMVMKADGEIEIHEVKGFWQDDAKVKIKVASEKFPFRFFAVQYKNNGWKYTEY